MALRKQKKSARFFRGGITPFLLVIGGLAIALIATQLNTIFRQQAAEHEKEFAPKYFKFIMPSDEHHPQEQFIVKMINPQDIQRATEELEKKSVRPLVVRGVIEKGDDGYNKNSGFTESGRWGWHLDSGTVVFDEVFSESCDGRPSGVESNFSQWEHKSFCPYGAYLEAAYSDQRDIKLF